MKIALTGPTFTIKDLLMKIHGQWRPDKNAYVFPWNYRKQVKEIAKTDHTFSWYEIDGPDVKSAKSSPTDTIDAKGKLLRIIRKARQLINAHKFDELEKYADAKYETLLDYSSKLLSDLGNTYSKTGRLKKGEQHECISDKDISDAIATICGSKNFTRKCGSHSISIGIGISEKSNPFVTVR